MTSAIEFAKLSGAGNDHLCIDNRDGRLDALLASPERIGHFARAVLRRGLGVGGDGVIFALRCDDPAAGDLRARFFEPDGGEAELCGNGTACFARWALDNRWVRGRTVRIATAAGTVRGRRAEGRYVRACIPTPREMTADIELVANGKPCRCDYAVTGTPHAVVYVDDVGLVDVPREAPAIRHHERFQPRGVNVNYAQVLGVGHIAVRTFEFGVEAETYACGTGASTVALLTALRFGWPERYLNMTEPILVDVRSGDTLRLFLRLGPDGAPQHACLETVVRFAYTGVLHADLAAEAFGVEEPAAAGGS